METTLDLMSTGEVAETLAVEQSVVINRIRKGEFPGARKLGWTWVIPKQDVLNHPLYPLKK